MKNIISVSRRTDIPTYYGNWFMNRITDGFAEYVNPFNPNQKYKVSLLPEDVICFVFWSKNYKPFLDNLTELDKMGYKFYLQHTITDYPKVFETNSPKLETIIDTVRHLSKTYSPKHILWRYDPIIISEITDYDYHIKKFEELASQLSGLVERCYFSFLVYYGKVKKNMETMIKENKINFNEPDKEYKLKLAGHLTDIAEKYNITMNTCCGDLLITNRIKKAKCVDGELIKELFNPEGYKPKSNPTREDCGCDASKDIGLYDTCPNGCFYCYANENKDKAKTRFRNHNPNSKTLTEKVVVLE